MSSSRYDWSKERFSEPKSKPCLCGCGQPTREATLREVGRGCFASTDCERRFFFGITCDCGRRHLSDEACPKCSADPVVEGRMRELAADEVRDDYMERVRR